MIFASLIFPFVPSPGSATVISRRFVDLIVTVMGKDSESSEARYAVIVVVPPLSARTVTGWLDVLIPSESDPCSQNTGTDRPG